MRALMCVCVYVCTLTCMYVCAYICALAHVHAYMYAYMGAHTHVCMRMRVRPCVTCVRACNVHVIRTSVRACMPTGKQKAKKL